PCLPSDGLYFRRALAEPCIHPCVENTKRLKLAPPDNPETDIGPLIRERQARMVEEHVEDAVRRGAQVLVGGRRPPLAPGFFYELTVLTGVHHGMRIMREETFGPVLPIQVVEDEAEAVRLADRKRVV